MALAVRLFKLLFSFRSRLMSVMLKLSGVRMAWVDERQTAGARASAAMRHALKAICIFVKT